MGGGCHNRADVRSAPHHEIPEDPLGRTHGDRLLYGLRRKAWDDLAPDALHLVDLAVQVGA